MRNDVKSLPKTGCPSSFSLVYRGADGEEGKWEVERRSDYFQTCGDATILSLSTSCEDMKKSAARTPAGPGDVAARDPSRATTPIPATPPDPRPVMSQDCRARLDAYGDAARKNDRATVASAYDAFRAQCQKDAAYLAKEAKQTLPERAYNSRSLNMINSLMDPVARMDALTNRSKDQPEYDLQKLITFGLQITAVAATAYRVSAPPRAVSVPAGRAPAATIRTTQPPTPAVPRSSGISGTP
jgi:hypothetical protein